MQAMALIAAYIAGTNKESMDGKIFDRDRSKLRTQKQKESKIDNKPMLIGKSKKFNVEKTKIANQVSANLKKFEI